MGAYLLVYHETSGNILKNGLDYGGFYLHGHSIWQITEIRHLHFILDDTSFYEQ